MQQRKAQSEKAAATDLVHTASGWPNVADRRPRASGFEFGTEPSSPGNKDHIPDSTFERVYHKIDQAFDEAIELLAT
jgi:hypothetical protein